MTQREQISAAENFVSRWASRGYEKGEAQLFWIELLQEVYGVTDIDSFIRFEQNAKIDKNAFIDCRLPKTKVLIEQKSIDVGLDDKIRQSDKTLKTPYEQARDYIGNLPVEEHPQWVVTCNFRQFYIYNMSNPAAEPEKIELKDLKKEYHRLNFLVELKKDTYGHEAELSLSAGTLVGKLYNELLTLYKDKDSESTLKGLNMLCVRIVFCLYAEDSGLFRSKKQFHDFVASFQPDNLREGLKILFEVLATEEEKRDRELADKYLDFPYVNGGLFSDGSISIPTMNEAVKTIILSDMSDGFDWSEISPTIFGSVFESTLNPAKRREGGMHYTYIKDIHKVIDPLFLDDLKAEFDELKNIKVRKTRNSRLIDFQKKIGSLKFLDPACGSGNFLTETYLSLRRLENECLKVRFTHELGSIQTELYIEDNDLVFVSIGQFYGIEINDFAVNVAKTALWIAENQMLEETSNILSHNFDFLPLKSISHIVEANALKKDWNDVVGSDEVDYIMGNPPFSGKKDQSKEQKSELVSLFPCKMKGVSNLDYVSGWYVKALDYIQNTKIKCSFVSTNSITQGEQVSILWKYLMSRGLVINFAYRSFIWESESTDKAAVYCVIIGFSLISIKDRTIFDGDSRISAQNINGYLSDSPDVFIEARTKPLCDVPEISAGNMPNDGGNLILTEDEANEFKGRNPSCVTYVKPFLGAEEFINNKKRYCLWLKDANPKDLTSSKDIMQRIENVRIMRSSSSREATNRLADFPMLFGEIRQPESDYLLIPSTSSEKRKYIPIGFLSSDIISSNANMLVPNASLYLFGILTSNAHNTWMRSVCGRLKSDYRYSNTIVYNNFPFPEPTDEQRLEIEESAKEILDAREKYPDSSLGKMYSNILFYPDLNKAHRKNDKAVMKAYGFPLDMSDDEILSRLFEMYKNLADK